MNTTSNLFLLLNRTSLFNQIQTDSKTVGLAYRISFAIYPFKIPYILLREKKNFEILI